MDKYISFKQISVFLAPLIPHAAALQNAVLTKGIYTGASRQSAARIAATVLTRAAVDRGSRDNVTVLVVDLSSGSTNAEALARTTSVAYSEASYFYCNIAICCQNICNCVLTMMSKRLL